MTVKLLVGDALTRLREIPDETFHTVVTSPPYWGLRDYGVGGQIGLEETPGAYVERMVAVFREIRRVLRPDGTLWVNMGDSYAGSGRGGNPTPETSTLEGGQSSQIASMVKRTARDVSGSQRKNCPPTRGSRLPAGLHEQQRLAGAIGRAWVPPPAGLKQKDLVGMPWRLAFALQADGWWLRQDIIWAKPNPMPESVRDRCTKAHEYVFLLSKSQRYYFDQGAIAEACSPETHPRLARNATAAGSARANGGTRSDRPMKALAPRLPGNVRPAKGCQAGLNGEQHHRTKAGLLAYAERARKAQNVPSGWDTGPGGHREARGRYTPKQNPDFEAATSAEVVGRRNKRSVWTIGSEPFKGAHFATYPTALVEPCISAGCPPGGNVLDPFGGAGTTALVADRLQRNCTLIELNPKYAAMALERLRHDAPLLADVQTSDAGVFHVEHQPLDSKPETELSCEPAAGGGERGGTP